MTQEGDTDNKRLVAVYDTADLQLLRADRLEPWNGGNTRAIACSDPNAEEVVLDVQKREPNSIEESKSRLTVRNGTVVREEALPGYQPVEPASYRVLEGDRIVEIPPKSSRLQTPAVAGNGIGEEVVSPDGTIVATWTAGSYDNKKYEFVGDGQILIVNQKTRRVIARWKPGKVVTKLAWTASGTLIARLGYRDGDYSDRYRPGEIVRLDRDLRPLSRGPGIPGQLMTVVGDSTVFSGNTPMRVSTASGRTVDFKDQRLAATRLVIPLGRQGFVDEEAPPEEPRAIQSSADSTDRTALGILVGLAVAIGIAAAGAMWRRAP